jgi:hypothetical protein
MKAGEDVRAGRWWWEPRHQGMRPPRAEHQALNRTIEQNNRGQNDMGIMNDIADAGVAANVEHLLQVQNDHLDRLEAEVDPHHARSGGRVQQPGAAVLRRQGFDRHAASGAQGVPPGRPQGGTAVPAGAHRHRPQLSRK